MMDLEKIFEHGSYQQRIDMIRKFDFDQGSKSNNYFVDLIKNNKSNNSWYTIELIDLAGYLEIIDVSLLKKYLSYLDKSCSYYLKLTVLDYVSYMYEDYKKYNVDYSSINKIVTNRYDRLITKNEALLTLMLLFPKDMEKYMVILKKNLKKTKNYREHIRVHNFLLNRNIDDIIPISDIKDLVSISKSKKYGIAVKEVIDEVENSLKYN